MTRTLLGVGTGQGDSPSSSEAAVQPMPEAETVSLPDSAVLPSVDGADQEVSRLVFDAVTPRVRLAFHAVMRHPHGLTRLTEETKGQKLAEMLRTVTLRITHVVMEHVDPKMTLAKQSAIINEWGQKAVRDFVVSLGLNGQSRPLPASSQGSAKGSVVA